jgi:hypothetical protein
MTKRVVDAHEVTIWRYDDDSIDLSCFREDCDIDTYTAYMESLVIARSLGEEIQDDAEVFSIGAYAHGTVSTRWRDEAGGRTGWNSFKWVKQRLFHASYGGLLNYTPPSERLMTIIWYAEFLLARFISRLNPPEEPVTPEEEVVIGDMTNVIVLADHR